MRAALVAALALCGLAIILGTVFSAMTAACGVRVRHAGNPDNEARCETRLHPIGPISVLLGVAAGVLILRGSPAIALGIGLILFALGWLFGLSAGFFGIGAGGLVIAGCMVALVDQRRNRPVAVR